MTAEANVTAANYTPRPGPAGAGPIYRTLLRSTAIYSLSVIADRSASFVMLPVYTRFLTTSDYGTLELLNLTASLVGMLLGIRLGQAIFFFYFNAPSIKERDAYIRTAFLGSLFAGGALTALALPFCSSISTLMLGTATYSFCFKLLFVSLGASLPVEVGLSYVRVTEQPTLYVAICLCRLICGIALNVILLAQFHLGIAALLWSSVALAVTTALWFAWFFLSNFGAAFSFSKLAALMRYSLPLGITGIAMFVVHFCDRFFLRWNVSLGEIGVYALAYQLGWIVAVVQLPFANYWNSQAIAILRAPAGERVYSRTCTYMILALSGTAVLVCVFARPVLQAMVPPAFRECEKYLPVLAGAYVLRALGDFVRYILVLEKHTSWDAAITTAGAVTALLGYALLIPRFKLWGAVEATVAAFAVMFVFGFWKAQKTRAFQYEYLRLAQIAICACISITVVNVIHPSSLTLQAALAITSAMLFPLLLWVFGFATRDERERLGLVLSIARKRFLFA